MAVLQGDGTEVVICPVAELEDGQPLLVEVGGLELGIIKYGELVVAYENRCAHQGGPVCTGDVVGKYEQLLNPDGTVAGERFSTEEIHLVCPWHGWEYDLRTGVNVADPRFRLRGFRTSVREGQVVVNIGRALAAGRLQGDRA
jgi:nitrite reductase/ring-hydroxylating ferredoxin subunit